MAIVSLLAGFVLLSAFFALGRWYVAADPKRLIAMARPALITLVALAATFLALTGRLWFAVMLAPLVLPVLRGLLRGRGRSNGGAAAGRSAIRTRFLEMTLDHEGGRFDGTVLDGPEAGRRLSALPLATLLRLLAHYQAQDAQSAQVLMAYLDRTHPQWHAAAGGSGGSGGSGDGGDGGGRGNGGSGGDHGPPRAEPAAMSAAEAYQVLGLQPGASAREIEDAHRRLIALVHPDKGGSSFLAAQVNRARDVLLGR